MSRALSGLLSGLLFALSALVGVVAFLYPFLLPAATAGTLTGTAPLLTVVLLLLALFVLLVEVQGQAVSAKMVAALGVMVAITSVLRFVEVAIPGPGGFSPIFAPIILGGYVFGARFGFLMGTMTLLVSGLITAGVGPWLPYQMFAAGWVGLSAGWLPHPQRPRLEVALLAGFGVFWGLLYGLIMNLYSWPFIMGSAAGGVGEPGLWQGLLRYMTYYVTTSLVWDLVRSAGNGVLLLALGMPAVRALMRFRDRFHFVVVREEGGVSP